MQKPSFILLLIIFVAGGFVNVHAQSDVIKNVRTAMKTGSSKELVKYINNTVELTFDGAKSSYSKTQAEFILKDFFKKYPPKDFQYIHQGASRQEGLKYVIGKYTYENGSFRVYMLFKQFKGVYLVDLIDFSKE
jgi:uncharacterized protein DUF4783